MWWLLYTTLTIHTYICIFIYIRMRYYNVNIYLQQLVPVSFWALFIICFLAHFSITDPSVCPRVSFSSLCLFVFFWLSLLLFPNSESKWYLFGIIFCFWGDAASSSLSLCGCVSASASDAHSQVFWHFDILLFCVDFCLKSRFNAYVIYENNTRTDVDDNVRPLRTFSHVDDGQTCREEITTNTRI